MDEELCRLCLTVYSDNNAYKLSHESDIMRKLSHLNLQLTINTSLPSQVCDMCYNRVEDMYIFRKKVIQNEIKLIQRLKHGDDSLKSYYENLRGKKDTEKNIEDSFLDCKHMKYEVKDALDTEDNTIDIKIENGIDLADVSDDDINLAQFKRNKYDTERSSKEFAKVHTDLTKNKGNKEIEANNLCKESNDSKIGYTIEINQDYNIIDNNTKDIETSNTKTRSNNTNIETNNTNYLQFSDHKCLTCFKYVATQILLIKHYRTEHRSKMNIGDVENINDFTYNETEDKVPFYKCSLCDIICKSKDEIEKHVGMHSPERPYVCKLCGRTFKRVYDIARHGRVHFGQSLHCSHGCGFSTVHVAALRDHQRRHLKQFNFTCKTCGKGFHVKTWHDQHQNVHNNVKPFECDLCGMAFHMERYLTSHRSKVHLQAPSGRLSVTRFICTHCSRPFDNKSSLNLHLEEHTKQAKYLCDVCGHESATLGLMKAHKKRHFGRTRLNSFSCSTCNKCFATRYSLKTHEKSHTGEKIPCSACGKSFAQKSTLFRHWRRNHPDEQLPSKISTDL